MNDSGPTRAVCVKLLIFLVALVAATVAGLSPAPPESDSAIFYSVIAGLSNKDPSWSPTVPLANWSGTSQCPGSQCTFGCVSASQTPLSGGGPLNLTLPSTFNYFSSFTLSQCGLTGTIDLAHLPSGLTNLELFGNSLTGSVDLTNLPSGLISIELNENNFFGTVDLTKLPDSIELLDLSSNGFSGSVDLTKLGVMNTLNLNNNAFTGSVLLEQIPVQLAQLNLHTNGFTGSIDFTRLPLGLGQLDLRHNRFSGSVDLTQLPSPGPSVEGLTSLLLANNSFSGSVNLGALPPGFNTLDLSSNNFAGALNLSSVPEDLGLLNLSHNNFVGTYNLRFRGPYGSTLTVDVSFNAMSGPIQVSEFPSMMQAGYFDHNGFTGTVNLAALSPNMEILDLSFNTLSGPVDLSQLSSSLFQLFLDHNQFNGTVDATSVPSSVSVVDMTSNPLFAAWVAPRQSPLRVDSTVSIHTSSAPSATLSPAFYTTTLSNRPLILFSTGYMAFPPCQVQTSTQSLKFSGATGFVGDSAILAAGLAACLPAPAQAGAQYQYIMAPDGNNLVFVTNAGPNLTFTLYTK